MRLASHLVIHVVFLIHFHRLPRMRLVLLKRLLMFTMMAAMGQLALSMVLVVGVTFPSSVHRIEFPDGGITIMWATPNPWVPKDAVCWAPGLYYGRNYGSWCIQWWPWISYHHSGDFMQTFVGFPIWPMNILIVLCCCRAWRRLNRVSRGIACKACHYPRSGLPKSSVCPECGTKGE